MGSNHERRYGKWFANEPWWSMHLVNYERASDWEGMEEVLEQQMFALAKARRERGR